MIRTLLKPLAAAAFVLGAAQAHADTVDFLGSAHGGKTVNYSVMAGGLTASGFGYAGGFTTTLNGGPLFTSYCVDLFEYINFTDPAYTNYKNVDASAHLFANSRAVTDLGKLFSAHPVVNTELAETAFQIAVWEIAYETASTYSLSSGKAKFWGGQAASDGALTLASSWLARLSDVTTITHLNVLESNAKTGPVGAVPRQDVVFATPVPEPSTYALMAAGLLSVGFIARRRAPRQA